MANKMSKTVKELYENLKGCGNHSCLIKKNSGMSTCAGCLCIPLSGGKMDIESYEKIITSLQYRDAKIKELETTLEMIFNLARDKKND